MAIAFKSIFGSRSRSGLERLKWASIRDITALSKHVRIRTNSEEFGRIIERMMRSFRQPKGSFKEPDATLSILVADGGDPKEPHRFYYNGKLKRETNQLWKLMRLLEWQLDAFLVWNESEYLTLHAGSVAIEGRGVLIPGSSGAGKSSLTMSLLVNGAKYYSDELSAISVHTGELVPFPKALSCRDTSMYPEIDERAWFGPTESDLAAGLEPDGWKPVWFTHADDVRPESVGNPVKITHVIFPQRGDGNSPQLEPISSSEVMRGLLRHSMNYKRAQEGGFHRLALAASEIQGFRLIGNGLKSTTRLVAETVAGAAV